jgi:hypothetical protein
MRRDLHPHQHGPGMHGEEQHTDRWAVQVEGWNVPAISCRCVSASLSIFSCAGRRNHACAVAMAAGLTRLDSLVVPVCHGLPTSGQRSARMGYMKI